MTSRVAPKRVFESATNTYSVTGTIGAGGSGTVFSVADADDAQFALKALDARKATSDRRARFANELRFCLRNDHPSIGRDDVP
jgi:hypothetical protein